MSLPDLSHLATPGATVTVRVTPKASANGIVLRDGQIRVNVTVVPEGGKANAAVQKLLAKAMGVEVELQMVDDFEGDGRAEIAARADPGRDGARQGLQRELSVLPFRE